VGALDLTAMVATMVKMAFDYVQPLVEKLQPHVEPLFAYVTPYVTPTNISMGVAGMLAFAGAVHALPGPTLKMQADQMGMPAWFIMCAGLLMMASSAVYWFIPAVGLYAVALCMGGAAATALKMPDIMHRPGGFVFSNATLGATLWVVYQETGAVTVVSVGMCAVCYLVGVAGRLFIPSHPLDIKLLGCLAGKEKQEPRTEKKAEEKKSEEKKAATPDNNTGEAPPATTTMAAAATKEEPGARKRISSPAPPTKAAAVAK